MIHSIRAAAISLSLCLLLLSPAHLASAQTGYDALVSSARAALQSGQNEQAVTAANRAIAADKTRWEAYAVAGGALMNLKRYEDAADQLSQAIQHAPESKQPGLRDLRKQCFLAESGATPAAPTAAPAAAATTQAEVVLWKSIERSTNADDFRTYLDKYPNGAFAPLAQRQLAEFDKIAEEQMARQAANSSSPGDTQRYLDRYPTGEHSEALRKRLPTLDRRSEIAKVSVLLNKHPQLAASLAPEGACAVLVKQETLDAEGLHSGKNPLIWLPGVQMAVVFAPGAHQVKFDSYTLDFSKLTPDQIAAKHERVPNQKKDIYTDTVQIDLPEAHTILVQLGVGSAHTKDTAKTIMNLTPDSCQIPGEKVDKCTADAVHPYHLKIGFANQQDATLYADNLKLATGTCAVAAPPVVPVAPAKEIAASIPSAASAAPVPSLASTAATPAPSVPAPSAAPAPPSAPAPSAILHIIRNSSNGSNFHPYLLIDQQRVTAVLNRQSVKMLLPPGKHTIAVDDKDVYGSEAPELVMEAGKEYWIKLSLSAGLMKPHTKLTIEPSQSAQAESAKFDEINFGDAFKK